MARITDYIPRCPVGCDYSSKLPDTCFSIWVRSRRCGCLCLAEAKVFSGTPHSVQKGEFSESKHERFSLLVTNECDHVVQFISGNKQG